LNSKEIIPISTVIYYYSPATTNLALKRRPIGSKNIGLKKEKKHEHVIDELPSVGFSERELTHFWAHYVKMVENTPKLSSNKM